MKLLNSIFGILFTVLGVMGLIAWITKANEGWLIPAIVLILLGLYLLNTKEE